jgi:hypothetical protein
VNLREAMRAKVREIPAGGKDAETMGADDPYDLKGLLKRQGGSQSALPKLLFGAH